MQVANKFSLPKPGCDSQNALWENGLGPPEGHPMHKFKRGLRRAFEETEP